MLWALCCTHGGDRHHAVTAQKASASFLLLLVGNVSKHRSSYFLLPLTLSLASSLVFSWRTSWKDRFHIPPPGLLSLFIVSRFVKKTKRSKERNPLRSIKPTLWKESGSAGSKGSLRLLLLLPDTNAAACCSDVWPRGRKRFVTEGGSFSYCMKTYVTITTGTRRTVWVCCMSALTSDRKERDKAYTVCLCVRTRPLDQHPQ